MNPKSIIQTFFGIANSKTVSIGDWIIVAISFAYSAYHLFGISEDPSVTLGVLSLISGLISLVFAIKKPSDLLKSAFTKKKK